jgi:PTH2 family peptidyl-tRNA hydrolase
MSTSSDEATLVVLVRRDLEMSTGKSAAQVAHAAVGCSLKARKQATAQFGRWRSEHGRIVVLAVDDLQTLEGHLEEAQAHRLVHHAVTDAGRTEVAPGTLTVLGLGPAPKSVLDVLVGHLEPL